MMKLELEMNLDNAAFRDAEDCEVLAQREG